MSKIPKKLLLEMLADPFYQTCCLKDENCEGFLRFHHNMIYAGSQVQEKWAILRVCDWHHDREKNPVHGDRLDFIMMTRMTEQDEEKYPRFNWRQLQRYLESKNRH